MSGSRPVAAAGAAGATELDRRPLPFAAPFLIAASGGVSSSAESSTESGRAREVEGMGLTEKKAIRRLQDKTALSCQLRKPAEICYSYDLVTAAISTILTGWRQHRLNSVTHPRSLPRHASTSRTALGSGTVPPPA